MLNFRNNPLLSIENSIKYGILIMGLEKDFKKSDTTQGRRIIHRGSMYEGQNQRFLKKEKSLVAESEMQ